MKKIQELLDEIAVAVELPVGSVRLVRMAKDGRKTDINEGSVRASPLMLKPPVIDADNDIYLVTTMGGYYIAWFRLRQLPGCCAFCLSTGAHVDHQFQRKGVNKIAMRLREHIAEWAGYSAIICTDIESNHAQRKSLAANGWQDIFSVVNKRTGNNVIVSVKKLNPTENL